MNRRGEGTQGMAIPWTLLLANQLQNPLLQQTALEKSSVIADCLLNHANRANRARKQAWIIDYSAAICVLTLTAIVVLLQDCSS